MVLIDEPAAKAPPDRPRVLIDELFDNGGVGAGFEACSGCTHTISTLALSNLVQNALSSVRTAGMGAPDTVLRRSGVATAPSREHFCSSGL